MNEEFWEHLGWTWYQIMIKERWGTPTVHLSCDFSVPSYFGQELDFEVRVLKVGRSSLTLQRQRTTTNLQNPNLEIQFLSEIRWHRKVTRQVNRWCAPAFLDHNLIPGPAQMFPELFIHVVQNI